MSYGDKAINLSHKEFRKHLIRNFVQTAQDMNPVPSRDRGRPLPTETQLTHPKVKKKERKTPSTGLYNESLVSAEFVQIKTKSPESNSRAKTVM